MSFNIPILFLCFNRPEETKRSFEIIQTLQPKHLYIAQDGPRNNDEALLTNEVKKIVYNINWQCDVNYLIREKNLGLRRAVNGAIDWFFDKVEMGIVIEDDILPDLSFFYFAEKLLLKYKDDTRIMLICGNNQLNEYPGDGDYFFSKTGAIWGWASWRRVWEVHDKEMIEWEKIKINEVASQILIREYWNERVRNMDNVLSGKIDSWSYVFTMTRLINSGLSIIPRKNLIQNIGFDKNATHTKVKPDYFYNEIQSIDVSNLKHPLIIAPDDNFDTILFRKRVPFVSFIQKAKNKIRAQLKTILHIR